MQLLCVKVGGETDLLTGAEYTSRLVNVEHALLTEHIDVVHAQLTIV